MNSLTQVKNLQKITAREAAAGVSEEASWHAHYKDSAFIFIRGLPYDIVEGDVLAVFAQYGEIMDLNLVRDKGTGKSKGFSFLAYEDQRSTILAVDNINGTKVLGRTIRVDHVANYKKKKQDDEEEEQRKREERGVCYAFQRGECNRGDACRFSHDEQRNANTGWGEKDGEEKWKHDRHEKRSREDDLHGRKFTEEDDRGERKFRADDSYSESRSRYCNSNGISRSKEHDRSRSKEYDQHRNSR